MSWLMRACLFAVYVCAFCLQCGLTAYAQSGSDHDAYDAVSSCLRRLDGFSANFRQIDESGNEYSGVFFLSKPRMKWDYYLPANLLVIVDDHRIKYYDRELNEYSVAYLPEAFYNVLTSLGDFPKSVTLLSFQRGWSSGSDVVLLEDRIYNSKVKLVVGCSLPMPVLYSIDVLGDEGFKVMSFYFSDARRRSFSDDDFAIDRRGYDAGIW